MNLAMAITSGLGSGFVFLGASALFKPIASELSLSRAATSVATSIARLEGGIQAPIAGALADKFGPKWLVMSGTVLLIAGLVWMYFIDSVWAYYLAWGIIVATGFNFGFTIAHDKVLTDWFIRKRGLALGTRFALFGIVGTSVLPLVSWLIITQGWRMSCLIWAGVIVATVPLSLIFIRRHRPEYYGLLPDGAIASDTEADAANMVDKGVAYAASLEEMEFTLKQAMRTKSYWMLIISWCSFGLIYGSFTLHCIPFLTDIGIAPAVAAGMLSLMNLINIPSRFLGGLFSDRLPKGKMQLLLSGAFIIQTLSFVALLLSQSTAMLYFFLVLFGLGTGAVTPLGITMRGRYFGRKAYGSIQGTSQMFAAPISILGPIYTGWVYDVYGSYMPAFILFGALAALTAVLMFFVRPPKPPAEAAALHGYA
jgi:sugar phosphate permease